MYVAKYEQCGMKDKRAPKQTESALTSTQLQKKTEKQIRHQTYRIAF